MPIAPDQVVVLKVANTPDWVFAVWDGLISHAWNGREACILQKDAIRALRSAAPMFVADIFETGWLDIEPAYRSVGWKVTYDKPAYNETYEAFFTFRK